MKRQLDYRETCTALLLILMFAPHVISAPTLTRAALAEAAPGMPLADTINSEADMLPLYTGGTVATYRTLWTAIGEERSTQRPYLAPRPPERS